jgi:hypothetical protein
MATPSTFAQKLASRAQNLHDTFHLNHETDPPLAAQIKQFWGDVGVPFPGVHEPWSAVFVSSSVKRAGATSKEFAFSPQHSVFVHRAIQNDIAGIGVFRGKRISDYSPAVGDIIQNNRSGNHFDFDFARTHGDYVSHSAIVVARGNDGAGEFVMTIGGNEGDSIRMKRIALSADGLIQQRAVSPFICVIQDLK